MRFSDRLSGLVTAAVGIAVVGMAASFPPMPGQPVGPALFPTVIGGGLVLFGLLLAWSGTGTKGAAWIQFDDWVRRPRMVLNLVVVIGSLLFYSFAVDFLGFLITAVVFLAVLFAAFGVRRALIPPMAAGVALLIHYAFYSLLRVPLPWGMLEAIAW
jgi:putative tricarboxylic transport membrane protein